MEIYDAKVWEDFQTGILEGKEIQYRKKSYGDSKFFFKEEDASLDDDTLLYQVYSYVQGDVNQQGNIKWVITIMQPLTVCGECNVTRGHYHENPHCAEIYYGIRGSGYLLLMDRNKQCYAEKVKPGSIHYIDGRIAHRLVNTGEDELVVGACCPTDAGHDYESIDRDPFPVRFFKVDGNIIMEEE